MLTKTLLNEGGIVDFDSDFLDQASSDLLFTTLKEKVKWEQLHYFNSFTNQKMPQPRLTAWYADDPEMEYQYSGVKQIVQPWLPEISEIKSKIEKVAGTTYNSVLLNYYRDQNDSVGLHSDNEKALGINPHIASLSLGATRKFIMKQNLPKDKRDQWGSMEFQLTNGSLLIMSGTTQHFWKHSIPKVLHTVGPRINLTFRKFFKV